MVVVRENGGGLVWYFDLDGKGGATEGILHYGLVGDIIMVGH